MNRPVPNLRVQIGQEVVLRPAEVEVLARDPSGRPTIIHLRPQVRPGEILCERLGEIPEILTEAECVVLLPKPAEHPHFDTWYRHRIDVAHAKYMEQISYSVPSDWKTFSPEAIEAYINGPGV
jgi:hypothetical protein